MSRFQPRDYLHFGGLQWRNKRRQRVWGRRFEAAVRDRTFKLPTAAVVQILPTEACNLRCPMCNQWGDNSYFLKGLRPVDHMNPEALAVLLRGLDPRESLISVHGGEPFAYKHTGRLLELLREGSFDVIFSTNGTLINRYLEPLAELQSPVFLLSIDGDEATHDAIRGPGNFRSTAEGIRALFRLRRKKGLPTPLVVLNFTACEYNTDVIQRMPEVARRLGAFVLNYNMRWFLTEEVGQAYETHLEEHFGVKSTGAWRGWISSRPDHDYTAAARNLRWVLRRRLPLLPPYQVTTPSQLRGSDFDRYFADYLNVFGNESCFMPFYWARIHSNGDLIYCPGHPDIIAGNVFRDGFDAAFNSEASIRFRQHILGNRLPICNRCCGLYMTNTARRQEQRARRRLGLGRKVAVHFPSGP